MNSYINKNKVNFQQKEPLLDQYFGVNQTNTSQRTRQENKLNSILDSDIKTSDRLSLIDKVKELETSIASSNISINELTQLEFTPTTPTDEPNDVIDTSESNSDRLSSLGKVKELKTNTASSFVSENTTQVDLAQVSPQTTNARIIDTSEQETSQQSLNSVVAELETSRANSNIGDDRTSIPTSQNTATTPSTEPNQQLRDQLSLNNAVRAIEATALEEISQFNYEDKEVIPTKTTSWIFDQSFISNQTGITPTSNNSSAIAIQDHHPLITSKYGIEISNEILQQNRYDTFDFNKFFAKQFIKKFFTARNQVIVDTPQEQFDLVVERAVQNSSLRNIIRAIAIGETRVNSQSRSSSLEAYSATEPNEIIRINAGGSEYTDTQGNVWSADQYFLNGNVGLYPGRAISNTEDDVLYRSERWDDDLAYDIPLLNGNYTVNLHFTENFFDSAESRVFDVSLEDTVVIDDLDLYQSRSNAAFDGQNSAYIVSVPQVQVNDGVLDLDAIASTNNAKLSAIEIIPINGPQVLINQTNGNTSLTEGLNSDNYSLVLNSRPSADVTIDLRVDNLLEVSTRRITFTPENFDIPQEIEVSAPDNNALTGTRRVLINSRVRSEDRAFNNLRVPNLAVSILDDESINIDFRQRVITNIERPTTAAWGPDNRLYVGTVSGLIQIYTFDDNYNVIDTQTVETIQNQEESTSILGIAFNPYDTSDSPTIYVSRSTIRIELDPNAPRTPLPNPTEFSNRVSTLDGANFENLNDIVTGLPVSGFDHGVNGLQFDNNGDLLIAVGGTTDFGFVDDTFRTTVPESPLSGAILRAEISKPDFNGNVTYEFVPGTYVPPGADPSNQNNGSLVRVAPGSDVSVYAAGFRNPYDLVFTTQGRLFATDNGANGVADDELNLVQEGGFFGHANPARALEDPRQAVSIFDPNVPSSDTFTAPLTTFPASTNGLDEFRSNVFGGQLRGTLFSPNLFNGTVLNFELSEDQEQVVNTQVFDLGSSLDLVTAPGGALVGVDFLDNLIRISIPNDESVSSQTIAFDISVSRASATGGNEFIIAGANFGDLDDTTVMIGDQTAYLTSVSDQRIVGILPAFEPTYDEILDVVVESNGNTSTIDDAFRPLF